MNKKKLAQLFSKIFRKSGSQQELKELQVLSARDPSDMRIKMKIGEIYLKKRDLRHAIPLFQEVAEHYTESGFLLKSIAIYKNILKFSPGSVEYNEKLGELYHKLGMRPDAVRQHQIAIHYYLNHGKGETAIAACRKLIAVDPDDPRHRLQLAEIYSHQGLQEESLQEYESLARTLRKEKKSLDMLTGIYEKILLKKPKEMGLLKELCVFYLKLRQPQKVLRKIEKYRLEQDASFQPLYQKALQLKEYLAATKEEKKE